MRSLMKFLVLPAAVAAAACAWVAASPAEAAAPPSDLTGYFTGKLKAKVNPLSTDRPSGGNNGAELSLSQEGNDLGGTLTVHTGDRGTLVFSLSGTASDGRFWLVGEGENGLMLLTGTARGASPKMKIKGVGNLVNDDEFIDIKYSVKQSQDI